MRGRSPRGKGRRNVLETLVSMVDGERANSPQSIVDGVAETLGRIGAQPLDTMISMYVRATLAACNGNKSAAARALGITRWRLARLLAREGA